MPIKREKVIIVCVACVTHFYQCVCMCVCAFLIELQLSFRLVEWDRQEGQLDKLCDQEHRVKERLYHQLMSRKRFVRFADGLSGNLKSARSSAVGQLARPVC